jgi:hypothetical protein
MPWSRRFEDPVELPDGRKMLTLKEAADYIMKIAKGRTAPRGMAGGDRSADHGGGTSRAADACTHRGAARFEPQHRTNVS